MDENPPDKLKPTTNMTPFALACQNLTLRQLNQYFLRLVVLALHPIRLRNATELSLSTAHF